LHYLSDVYTEWSGLYYPSRSCWQFWGRAAEASWTKSPGRFFFSPRVPANAIAGIEQILISVATTQQAAVSLYRSLGFEAFGREPRALKVAGRLIDEEFMVLLLPRPE